MDMSDQPEPGTIYIEWHECDLSFDFHCKCGARLSGGGAYCTYIKCPRCSRTYAMPLELVLEEVQLVPYGIEPAMLDDDGD